MNYKETLDWLFAQLPMYQREGKAAYKAKLLNAFKNKQKNRYVLISPRRINHLEIKTIRQFPIFRLGQNKGGLILKQTNRRLLPHGSMAKRTIGMVNLSGTKVGIEGAFDTILKGIDGNELRQALFINRPHPADCLYTGTQGRSGIKWHQGHFR